MKVIKNNMYIIVDKKGVGRISTLSYYKKDCISLFEDIFREKWLTLKKYGWKCEKVDVNIRSCSNFNSWN